MNTNLHIGTTPHGSDGDPDSPFNLKDSDPTSQIRSVIYILYAVELDLQMVPETSVQYISM